MNLKNGFIRANNVNSGFSFSFIFYWLYNVVV